jgi:ferritin-like metal-binding protein YciE
LIKESPNTKTNQRPDAGEEMDNGLHELFLDELADLLSAEQQLTKALPKMANAAKAPELREAFQNHLEETENHATRLVQVFESVGAKAKKKTCKAMQGLIEEGSELV